jgi:hypothetical protein
VSSDNLSKTPKIRRSGLLGVIAVFVALFTLSFAEDEPTDLAAQRMGVMKAHIETARISSHDPELPRAMHPTPLFRYDDETRGYVDGTVWRLGETGRPLAIVTTELHPDYLGGGPRMVYDLLSLTERRFTFRSKDIVNWSPTGSAVTMQP